MIPQFITAIMLTVCHMISGDIWAGAEVMVCHLLNGLRTFPELQLRVILMNEGRLSEEIRKLGVDVDVVEESANPFFRALPMLREVLRRVKPDIIPSHGYKENILSSLLSKSFPGVKRVGTQHGLPRVAGKKYGLRHRLITRCNLFLLSRCFHRVVGVSQEIQEIFVRKYRFPGSKVVVIHNGIEIPDLPAIREHGDDFIIGSAGRLFPVKDYRLMIEIAAAIRRKTDRVRFRLAGEGPEKMQLQTLRSRNHVEDVFTLTGHLHDLSPFYRGLDVYLNTSLHEGLPISVLEAMACRLPVIAPRVGGFPEIIDNGVQGYLIGERNPEIFAQRCLSIYNNNVLKRKMGEAARARVEAEFSAEQMARNYFNLYAGLVRGS